MHPSPPLPLPCERTYLFCAIRPEVTYHKYTFATLGFAKNASVVKLKPKMTTVKATPAEKKLMEELEQMKVLLRFACFKPRMAPMSFNGGGSRASRAEQNIGWRQRLGTSSPGCLPSLGGCQVSVLSTAMRLGLLQKPANSREPRRYITEQHISTQSGASRKNQNINFFSITTKEWLMEKKKIAPLRTYEQPTGLDWIDETNENRPWWNS